MAVSGLAHGFVGGHSHGSGGTHGGGTAHHGLGAGHHGQTAHAGHSHPAVIKSAGIAKSPQQPTQVSTSLGTRLLMTISPLDIFMLAGGAGLTGVLLGHVLAGNVLVFCACIGALLFDFGVIRPILGLLLRFASNPSENLEGAIASTGVAMTRFDAEGRGLIKLTIDGAESQLLATLDPSEFAAGVAVGKGDLLLVTEVDGARNVCRVSRELAPSLADVASDLNAQVNLRS
jgi:hypothetical protein